MRIFTIAFGLLCASAVSAQSFSVNENAQAQNSSLNPFTASDPAALIAPQAAPQRAAKHPVDEQPEGRLLTYAMNTLYFTRDMGEPVHRYGQKTMVVINDEDDEIWIQNFINTFLYGNWICGEISADR